MYYQTICMYLNNLTSISSIFHFIFRIVILINPKNFEGHFILERTIYQKYLVHHHPHIHHYLIGLS